MRSRRRRRAPLPEVQEGPPTRGATAGFPRSAGASSGARADGAEAIDGARGDDVSPPPVWRAEDVAGGRGDRAGGRSDAGTTGRSRRWIWWALAIVLAGVLGSILGFGPLVREVARRQAYRRGLELLRIEHVLPGFGAVVLEGIDLRFLGVPSVAIEVERVKVSPTLTFGVGRVDIAGGSVRVEGELGEVAGQLRRWKRSRGSGSGGAVTTSDREYQVSGIDVRWIGAAGGDEVQCVEGVEYRRTAEDEWLSARRVELAWAGSQLDLMGARVDLGRNQSGRVIRSIGAERVTATLDLDGQALSALLGLEDGGARRDAVKTPGAGPVPQAPARTARPEPRRAAKRRARGERWRSQLDRATEQLASILAPGAKVDVGGVRLQLRHGKERLSVGPGRFSVERSQARIRLRLVPGSASQRAPVTLSLDLPLGSGPVKMQIAGGPVNLATLGVQEGDMGLTRVDRARLDVRGRAVLAADGSTLELSGKSRVSDLSIEHPKLAPEAVTGLSVALSGGGTLWLDGSRVQLSDTELTVGRVKGRLSGQVEHRDGDFKAKVDTAIPLAACQDMLDSTPRQLIPELRGMKASGTFAFDGHLELDTLHPGDAVIDWKASNECRVTAVPRAVDPRRFSRPFTRTVRGADGEPVRLESGPGSPSWVPLYDISPYMETGVIVCEDARFFHHDGFDEEAIKDSIRDNLRAGQFVRGASTVSMQLAKNLYLGREKTLSRKLQEAALTLLLEQVLSKEAILELYLNVIEFGPGVYGIRHAAEHYFKSAPRDLSLGQSLYLTSILPNPSHQHLSDDGTVTEPWMDYLHRLMRIAHKIGRITDAELEAGLSEVVSYGQPYDPTRPSGELSEALEDFALPSPSRSEGLR